MDQIIIVEHLTYRSY